MTTIAGFRPNRIDDPHVVAVLAFDGVVLGDLAIPCEIFARARSDQGRSLYEVRVCSRASQVQSEHLCIGAPWRLASLQRADTVIIPGISDLDRPVSPAIIAAIRRAAHRGVRIASICTGAFILAATGLLDGERATTHWRAAPELARRYPAVDVDPRVLYVDNGQLLSSAGAVAGLDLCLHLVRADHGARVAADVARSSVMPLERAGGQAQFIVHEQPSADGSSLQTLLSWLERNLGGNLSLDAMARKARMSTRTLSRRFREQTGSTPAQWLVRARVRRAQHLLEASSLAVERIANEVGFGSAATLRERFHHIVGTSPQAYRRAFCVAREPHTAIPA